MSAKLATHRRFLEALSQNPALVRYATPSQLACIVEILHNLHKVALSSKEKRCIDKVLPIVKQIAKIRREDNARQQLVQYGGAILPFILPAALSLLLSAV